jgi:hypothetical protein
MIGTTTTTRVHLDLCLCVSRLRPLISPRGNIMGSPPLRRVVLPLEETWGKESQDAASCQEVTLRQDS